MLEVSKEPLDEIALTVQCEVGFALHFAICLGRDDGLDAPFLERRDQRVGVIALVGEERFRLDLIELPW